MLNQKIDEILSQIKSAPEQYKCMDYHVTYLNAVLKHVCVDGLWMEFGVYRGRSMRTIASCADKKKVHVYGFDSFEGLPDHWDSSNPKGCYSLAGSIPDGMIDDTYEWANPGMYDSSPTRATVPWPKNVTLIKGWFEDTLDSFLLDHPGDAAYIHIDSDVYSAAVTVLTKLKGRIVPGTIIDFDEICDYDDYREHEIKAFAEFLLDTGHEVECLCHQGVGYSQAAFKVTK